MKFIRGGVLVQDPFLAEIKEKDLRFVSEKKPNHHEIKDLLFSFKICQLSQSNAVTIVKNEQVLGNGLGATARVYAVKEALEVAKKRALGAVAASDGFFPFVDGPALLVKAGISAIIQPSGSIRDKEIIDFCNQRKIALVFSPFRAFRH